MVTRRQAVIAGILAALVLAAAVVLLVASGHDHHPPHKLLVGDEAPSTTSSTALPTTTALPATTTTARPAVAPPETTTTAAVRHGGIAYRDSGGGISVMNPDGSHAHRIATFDQSRTSTKKDAPYLGGETFWGLDWSPTGTLIAATRNGKYGGGLEVMRPDGTARRTLVWDSAVENVNFSPDGQWLLFWDPGSYTPGTAAPWKLMIISVDGHGLRALDGDAPYGNADWSPDGTRIVVAWNQKLTIVQAADGTKMSEIPMPAGVTAQDAAWSPDGAWIAFTGAQPKTDLYKVHPDGSGLVALSDTARDVMAESPSWSPDSSHLVFRERVGASDGTTTSQVWTMTADGGDQQRLITLSSGIGQLAWA